MITEEHGHDTTSMEEDELIVDMVFGRWSRGRSIVKRH